MPRKVNIIDADTLAVAAAAVAQKTSILATYRPTGKSKSFKNITELKKVMKEKGTLDKLVDTEIKSVIEPSPVTHALANTRNMLQKIEDFVKADKTIVVVGAKADYRQALDLPSPYKNKRGEKPVHLQACKQYLVEKKSAYFVDGIECDDETCILAEEYKQKGWDVILSSPDHDSFQMHGIWLLNYKESKLEDGLRFLSDHHFTTIKKGSYSKSSGSGVGYLAGQLLFGDSTDTYSPTELAGLKYGMQSAKRDLESCVKPKDFLEVVKRKYQEWYPSAITYTTWDSRQCTKDWREILQMYFKCVYMLRGRDDKACVQKFFANFGVIL
jgi:hypothetical protein